MALFLLPSSLYIQLPFCISSFLLVICRQTKQKTNKTTHKQEKQKQTKQCKQKKTYQNKPNTKYNNTKPTKSQKGGGGHKHKEN